MFRDTSNINPHILVDEFQINFRVFINFWILSEMIWTKLMKKTKCVI